MNILTGSSMGLKGGKVFCSIGEGNLIKEMGEVQVGVLGDL